MEIVTLLETFRYWFLFFGLLLAGEIVLIPAIYLSLTGYLSPWMVGAISLSATILSDLVWYWIGRFIPLERILNWRIARGWRPKLESLLSRFHERAAWLIFYSKFVYGTRTVAQVVAGRLRANFPKYLIANISGSGFYIIILFILGSAVHTSLSGFTDAVGELWLYFPIFILLAIGVNFIFHRLSERNDKRDHSSSERGQDDRADNPNA